MAGPLADRHDGEVPVLDHVSFDAPFPEDRTGDDLPAGADLAGVVRQGMLRRGVECGVLEDNDYAYSFTAAAPDGQCLVMVGHVGDSDGRQWLALVQPVATGLLRRRRPDPATVVTALHEVLVEDISASPQWFTEAQWNTSAFGRGRPTPFGAD